MKNLFGRKPNPPQTPEFKPVDLPGFHFGADKWIRDQRSLGLKHLMPLLKRKLEGYWAAYGVTGNMDSLNKFWRAACQLLYKWLNRRSQRRSYSWSGLYAMLEHFGIKGPRIVDDRQMRLNLW